MPWSDGRFILALSHDRVAPRFYLESVPMGQTYTGGHPIGGNVKFSSHPATGYIDCIRPTDCSIKHATLTPGTWSRSAGSLTIATSLSARNPEHVDRIQACRRGQYFRLRVELDGGIETVWVGVLRGISWSMKGGYVLELLELIGGLTTRNTSSGERAPLFSGLSTTTIASPHTDGGTSITVADASGFEQATGQAHLVRITPNSGNPFYVTATKAGNVFTVTAADIFDTVDADASAGNLVEEIAYVARHPITTAARLLVSTGTGTNGTSDVLPERWGLGISTDFVDEGHMSQMQARLDSTSYVAYLRVDAAQDDGLGWLSDWLSQFGLFLAMRQGQITCRAVQVWGTDPVEVTDHDIASGGLSYEAWDGDSPVEYAVWRTTYGTLSETAAFSGDAQVDIDTESIAATRPIRHLRGWACPDIWRADLDLPITADTQASAWNTDVPRRLYFWATRPPERVRIRLARWTTAGACLGDTMRLTSDLLPGRYDSPVFAFSSGKNGLIVGGGPDWFRGGCEWEVLFPADFDEAG